MDITEVKRRLFETHKDQVTIVDATYIGFKKRATFIDTEYGEWNAFVYGVCKGSKNPKRAVVARRSSIKEIQNRIDARFGTGNIIIKENSYTLFNNKCIFIDLEYGEFEALPHNVLHGIGHPQRWIESRSERTRMSIDKIEQEVNKASGGKVKLIGNYQGMLTKSLFFDSEYGEFEAYPVNVIHHKTRHPNSAPARREISMLKHFGVRHHMQIASQSLKVAIKNQNRYLETHWETGDTLVCVASWELKTVQWLNSHKIRFLWQPYSFFMPDGKRSYRPDAYLIDRDLWVEIKGRFYPSSEEKWNWFHSEYTNSELWNKEKLQELGILPKKKKSTTISTLIST